MAYQKKGFRRNDYDVTEEHFATAAENGLERRLVLKRVRDSFWPIERAISEPRKARNERWKGLESIEQ